MNQYQKLAEMYRSHPLSASLRSIRHRPYSRSFLYGCSVLISMYLLYSFVPFLLGPFSGDLSETYVPTDKIPPEIWQERAKRVKFAFLHGYHGYERYAQPHDEICPLSNNYRDKCVSYTLCNIRMD